MHRLILMLIILVFSGILLSQNAYYLNEDFVGTDYDFPEGWHGTMSVGVDAFDNNNPIMGAVFNQMWFDGGSRYATTPVVGPVFLGTVVEFTYRVVDGYAYKVPFDLGDDNFFKVLVGDVLVENIEHEPTLDWTVKTVSLDDFIGEFIAVTLLVESDDVSTYQVEFDSVKIYYPSVDNDLFSVQVVGFKMPSVGLPASNSVIVRNMGLLSATDYTVILKQKVENGEDIVLGTSAGESVLPGEDKAIAVNWIPETEGDIEIYGVIDYPLDIMENNTSVTYPVSVQALGTRFVYVGDEKSVRHNFFPIPVRLGSSVAQHIYKASDIGISGAIDRIGYIFHSVGDVANVPVNIYLGTTTTSAFFYGNEKWIDFEDFTLVYQGIFTSTSTETTNVYFDLIQPYYYDQTKGNLVVMANRILGSTNFEWQNFKHSLLPDGQYSGLAIDNDSFNYDLTNLPLDGVQVQGTFPNLILVFDANSVNEKEKVVKPDANNLKRNYPNPFNPVTTIEFELGLGTDVEIDVYNIRGQKVKNLVKGYYEMGTHSVTWNGIDENDLSVGSGVYFYRMRAGEYVGVGRMVLMK